MHPLLKILTKLFAGKKHILSIRPAPWIGLFLCCLLFSLGCPEKKPPTESDPGDVPVIDNDPDPDPGTPVTGFIHNLGVTFAAWDRGTDQAGDFTFVDAERKVFREFGDPLTNSSSQLPCFEYHLPREVSIRAITNGVIERAGPHPSGADYEIAMVCSDDKKWEIIYSHLLNLRVAAGDTVRAGDVLGNPGVWTPALGRFEISVNKIKTVTSYCPFCYFDEATTLVYQAKVAQHISEIEAFLGNTA